MSTPRAERGKKHILSFLGKNKKYRLNERPGKRRYQFELERKRFYVN